MAFAYSVIDVYKIKDKPAFVYHACKGSFLYLMVQVRQTRHLYLLLVQTICGPMIHYSSVFFLSDSAIKIAY